MNILFFDSMGQILHHIMLSIQSECERCGFKTTLIKIPRRIGRADWESTEKKIRSFNPDLIMMNGINGIAFNKESNLLDGFDTPYISLNFDYPIGLLRYDHNQFKYLIGIGVCDMDYYKILSQKGFKNIFHFPVAADTSLFFPQDLQKTYDLSFAGNITDNSDIKPKEIKAEFFAKADTYMKTWLTEFQGINFVHLHQNLLEEFPMQYREQMIYYFLCTATTEYRKRMISALGKLPIKGILVGNNWPQYQAFEHYKQFSYETQLPRLYNVTKINLNLSPPQLASSFNPRVLDIMASKGFLLTDSRLDILNFFEPDKELVLFNNSQELAEKINYYLEHSSERNQIAAAGYEKVIQLHTWKTRVDFLIRLFDLT